MASKVFVGNLDFNTTRDEVEALFAQVGTVRDVFLPTDRESGRPRGFAPPPVSFFTYSGTRSTPWECTPPRSAATSVSASSAASRSSMSQSRKTAVARARSP